MHVVRMQSLVQKKILGLMLDLAAGCSTGRPAVQNLGGLGPDLGAPGVLRFASVGSYGSMGSRYDLVVNASVGRAIMWPNLLDIDPAQQVPEEPPRARLARRAVQGDQRSTWQPRWH